MDLLVGQGLQHHFGQAFAGAHDAGGAHSLVGGDEHKAGNTLCLRGTCQGQGAQHVVGDAFGGVGLYQGDVFVGGGVVHGVGLVGRQHGSHVGGVAHVAQQGHQLGAGGVLGTQLIELSVDGVQAKLVVVHQHQLRRAFTQDLAAQLAADAASGTGDQDGLTRQRAVQGGGLGCYRFAAQQVFNVQLMKVRHGDAPAGQVGQAGQGADVHRQRLQAGNDLVAALAAGAG